MQPSKLSIAELFLQREQYLIPLFQRGYVWNLSDQIQPLWEDMVDRIEALKQHREDAQKLGTDDRLKKLRKHFLGAIIVGSPVSGDRVVNTREVIDGQQRIMTFQVMLLALKHVVMPLNDTGLDYDIGTLIHNPGEYRTAASHLKVWPTNASRDVILTLAQTGSLADVCQRFPVKGPNGVKIERPALVQAYLFFYAILSCYIRGARFDDSVSGTDYADDPTVAHVIARSIEKNNTISIPLIGRPAQVEPARLLISALQDCFQIMRLQLDDEDDPQIIFETLNARGTPLQPSDLIRNFLFLRAARDDQPVDDLYEAHWKVFDEKEEDGAGGKGTRFWKKVERQGRLRSSRLDLLLYHYVGLRTREEIKVTHVFQEFKSWWGERRDLTSELTRLNHIANYFETFLAPGQKTRFELFCRRLKLLDTATPTPLVFHLLEHHEPDDPDFEAAIADIESYLVRRFVCGLTTKGYNRIFLGRLLSELVAEDRWDSGTLREKLLELSGDSQVWPNDAQFREDWSSRRLYQGSSTRRVRAVLEALELASTEYGRELGLELESLSVEHVLPQKWKPNDYPLAPDGNGEARRRLLHCVGNLTLVTPGFNGALSNESFRIKRPEIVRESTLRLNAYFQNFSNEDVWDEKAIVARAEALFPLALKTWPYPQIG